MPVETPILLTVFNRPQHTRAVVEALRSLQPLQLYVAADGPRESVITDIDRCRSVIELVKNAAWPGETHYRISGTNLGCGRAMREAIDWFFSNVDRGVILEDDCVPHPDFFPFVRELLEKYEDDDRVAMIAGTNYLGEWQSNASYHFAAGPLPGWATWRNQWAMNDPGLGSLSDRHARDVAEATLGPERWSRLSGGLDLVQRGAVDTWDYQWSFAAASRGALTAIPHVNLIENIGFDSQGTHTKSGRSLLSRVRTRRMMFPLRHPADVVPDLAFERAVIRAETASLPARIVSQLRTAMRVVRQRAS